MTGHKTASSVSKFMSNFLNNSLSASLEKEGEKRYIVLEAGKNWKDTFYQNNAYKNIFRGEPGSTPTPFFQTLGNDFGYDWDVSYHFKGKHTPAVYETRDGNLRTWGSAHLSNERLYYILVNAYAGGQDFVDFYLHNVMPHTVGNEIEDKVGFAIKSWEETVQDSKNALESWKRQVRERKKDLPNAIEEMKSKIHDYGTNSEHRKKLNAQIKEVRQDVKKLESFVDFRKARLSKSGKLDKRFKGVASLLKAQSILFELVEERQTLIKETRTWQKNLKDFENRLQGLSTLPSKPHCYKRKDKNWTKEGEEVAEILRNDFIRCMINGQVTPLMGIHNTENTQRKKERYFGIANPIAFVCSDNFVRSIKFDVRIKVK
jgi:hypothetical protein